MTAFRAVRVGFRRLDAFRARLLGRLLALSRFGGGGAVVAWRQTTTDWLQGGQSPAGNSPKS